jgi:hypothetical protein
VVRPAVIVHDIEHARAAVSAAAALGVAIALRSAPGAAASLGPSVFRAMVDAARKSTATADVVAMMDCGQDAGRALSALRHGIERVRVNLPPPTVKRLAEIAGCYGATIEQDEGNALDLLNCDDPAAACRKWLAEGSK